MAIDSSLSQNFSAFDQTMAESKIGWCLLILIYLDVVSSHALLISLQWWGLFGQCIPSHKSMAPCKFLVYANPSNPWKMGILYPIERLVYENKLGITLDL